MVCKAFLQKHRPDKGSALLKHLAEPAKKKIQSLPSSSHDLTKGIDSVEITLSRFHPSWIVDAVASLPTEEATLFLSCMEQKKGLTPTARRFLQKQLLARIWKDPEILPLAFLPDSPLNCLLAASYEELQTLPEFLGLHDLQTEVKQMIETAKLKQIHAALSAKQENYLQMLLSKKEPIGFKRMALEKWKGDKKSLQKLIYQRGLNRLAKALFGQHPSLIWHLSHRFEKENAERLQSLCASVDLPQATAHLTTQVLELFSYIQSNRGYKRP